MPVIRALSPPPSRNPSIAGAQIMAMAPNTRLSRSFPSLLVTMRRITTTYPVFVGVARDTYRRSPRTNYRQFPRRPLLGSWVNRGRWFRVLNRIMTTDKDGTLRLSGGVDVPFRLIRSDDVPALQRFHGRLSEKTIYLRFFGSLEELPKEKAQFFAHVDGVDHLAFVALDPDDPDEIIALVRYDREPGSERAAYAALVEDRWQDHGVGIALTRELIDQARDKEVRFLYAR